MTIEEFRLKKQQMLNSSPSKSGTTGMTMDEFRAKKEKILSGKSEEPKIEETKIDTKAVEEANKIIEGAKLVSQAQNLMKLQQQRLMNSTNNLKDYAQTLPEEKINQLKEESPILNPEKYHKDVDAAYYGRKAIEGFSRAGEGIYDAARILVGGKENGLKAVQETPTENYAKLTDFIYNNAGKGHKLAGEVVSGVTAMAPTIAANLALPGAGYAAIGAQAFGSGTQQAYQTTGELGAKEKIYGLLGGLLEAGIEKISGGIGGLGNGAIDNIASKLIKNGLIRSATGEGIEEAVTTIIDPYLQRLTYDKGAEGAKASEVLRSAIVGSLTSMLLQGGTAAVNLPQTIQQNKENRAEIRNSLEGLDKMLPTYENVSETASTEKNVAPELPTMASRQAMLPTNQTEGKTAQNGNIEQIAKNIENNNILEYNNNRGVENGREQEIIEGRNQGNLEETKNERSNTPNGERNINQTMGSGAETRLEIARQAKIDRIPAETDIEKQIERKAKELGIDVYFFKNGNVEPGFAFENGIYLDKLGKDRPEVVFSHEVFHNARQNNNPVYASEIKPIMDEFADSTDFVDVFNKFNKTLQEEIPVNQLAEAKQEIIEEIFADYTAKILARYDIDYNMNSDMYKRLENSILKITQPFEVAFSMPKNHIDLSQDIQKAEEFVNNATLEDIDTLNRMAEEAERLDLQFFAEKVREAIEKLSRQQVRQVIMEETGVEEYNLDDINKISKVKMNFTTPVRVIEKIFNKETANKINENFFKPIKHNEAERIRRLNKERADIKELDIKPGSAEDAAIQKYGEGEYIDENGVTIPYTLENLKRDFPDTWQKLQNATNVIRNKYDTYLEEINEVLKDNGYDPIPKRKDYFRHFEELNDLFSILGVPTKVDDIPTDLNGMTADLKPGKQFFANALQRKGNKTTYSAIKGIDGYLDGAMNILYHTKDIQKLRTLDKYIRDTYGQTKGLAEASTMTDEQKAKRINQINEGHLSEFAAWLTEYTNALAGKKSRLDRGIEEMFGRKAYKYLNLIKKQVGANMTGLNINSALSNFISVTQAAPKTNKKALVKGTIDTVKNIFKNDGFIDKSDFLTTRFGTDKLAKNWWQKAGDVGQIFMSATDYFTANLITRSKYQEFLDKGYTEAEAIKKADEFADRLMAGRGKGDLPNAFESKMLGIVTQFQLEVTNQLDSIFYDTLHEDYTAESTSKLAKEHPKFYNAASATFILGQLFALAFLYNEGKEKLTGTEGGALDPIGTIADAMKHLTDENLSKPEAIAMIVEDIANQLPFASIITGGGRLPIKEAFPDLLSVLQGESKLGDEMWNLTNLLLPTGGGQIKKTTQGLNTFAKGGSYSKDAEGKDKLKYPVEQNVGNAIKSALFGKWSTPGARDYIDRGFKPLSANQTEAYNKAMKAGISSDDFFKVYDATRGIEGDKDRSGKTIENSKSEKLKEAIDKATPKLTSKQRKILYDAFNVSKTVQGGSGLPTQSELRANLPKVEIKIEK